MVVYKITNKLNGDCYVGKTTTTVQKRFYKHQYNALKLNFETHLYRAIRSYGIENFLIEEVDTASTIDELNRKEINLIQKISPNYNMTRGGDGGDTSHTPAYKQALANRDVRGNKNPMYGKTRHIPQQQLNNAHRAAKSANKCPIVCGGIRYESVGEAQSVHPGISIRKRIDSPKYPSFYRLREKTRRPRRG